MRKRDLQDGAKIEAAVQKVAEEYLKDPNITSVGIGYKLVGGQPTDELALQFTVSSKWEPQTLENTPTRPIPETLVVNGIRFPTDVIQRDYSPDPVAVDAPPKADRKRRLDVIVPGVSLGHERISAGTLGCLVREDATGETRMLSNWHVFQGPGSALGDRVGRIDVGEDRHALADERARDEDVGRAAAFVDRRGGIHRGLQRLQQRRALEEAHAHDRGEHAGAAAAHEHARDGIAIRDELHRSVELLHRLGDGGLEQAQALGRAREAGLLGDAHEHLHGIERIHGLFISHEQSF